MAMTFDTDVTLNAAKVLKFNTVNAPTTSGGTTYGPGSSGQVLKSNGTTMYWANSNEIVYSSSQPSNPTTGTIWLKPKS